MMSLHRRKLGSHQLDQHDHDPIDPLNAPISDLRIAYDAVYDAHPNWYNLGLALSVNPNQLSSLQNTNQGRTDCDEVCLRQMLDKRLQAGPLTWRDLCSALRSGTVYRHDVAEEIEQSPHPIIAKRQGKIISSWRWLLGVLVFLTMLCLCCYHCFNFPGTAEQKDEQYSEDPVYDQTLQFAKELNTGYIATPIIDKDQKLLSSIHGIGDTIPFVIPSMKSGEPLDQIIRNIQPGSRNLFTGRPGVGKSTLTRYMALQWAQGEWLTHCLLTVRVPSLSTAGSLHEVLAKALPDYNIVHTVSHVEREITANSGRQVCFILDALDEYVLVQDTWVYNLLKGDTLQNSTVIATSRNDSEVQNFVNSWPKTFSHFYEVIGFSAKCLDHYLDQLPVPLKDNISAVFDVSINVKLLCYLPLHMTMVVRLASLDRNKLSTVVTETILYTQFLALTIGHKSKHGWTGQMVENCLKDHTNTEYFCNLIYRICALAYDLLMSGKNSFDSGNFNSTEIKMLQELSLFDMELESDVYDYFYRFTFVHGTFKEYLAAFHMCQSSDAYDKMLPRANRQVFAPVWKFYFGFLRNIHDADKVYNIFLDFALRTNHAQCGHLGEDLLSIAYEAGINSFLLNFTQNTSLITGPECENFTVYYLSYTTRDCLYLAHVLKWIPVRNIVISFYLYDFGERNCIAAFQQELNQFEQKSIEEMTIFDDGSDERSFLVQLLSSVQAYNLVNLVLSFKIGEQSLNDLRELFSRLTKLHRLVVCLSPVLSSDSLVNGFCECLADLKSLEELSMTWVIGPNDSLPTAEALSNLSESMRHLVNLITLSFDCTLQSVDWQVLCPKVLAGVVQYLPNLEHLIIQRHIFVNANNSKQDNLLKEAFSVLKKLKKLEFTDCSFLGSAEGLFSILKETKTLGTLIVTANIYMSWPIIPKSIAELSQLEYLEFVFPIDEQYVKELNESLSVLPRLVSFEVHVLESYLLYDTRHRVIARFSGKSV